MVPQPGIGRSVSPAGRRRVAAWTFAAVWLLYAGTTGGSLTTTDATVEFDLTRNLVEHRSVALSGNLLGLESNRGVDGRYYSQYGIGQAVYDVPFYLAGKAAAQFLGSHFGRPDSLLKAAVASASSVSAAAAVVGVFLFAWDLTGDGGAAFAAAWLAGVASLLWPYALFGFNTALAAALVTNAARLAWAGVRDESLARLRWAGVLSGYAWLTRHEFAVLAGMLAVWLFAYGGRTLADRWRKLASFLPGVVAGGACWIAYNLVRFGHAFEVGYHPRFAIVGYWALIASPGGSVLLYSPTVIFGCVGLWRLTKQGDGRTAWLLGGSALLLYLISGSLRDWAGGRSYGPRYLVPALPLLAVAAAPVVHAAGRHARALIVAALTVGALWQLPGVLVDYSRVSMDWAAHISPGERAGRLEHWNASAFVLNTREAFAAVPRNIAILTGRSPRPPVSATGRDDDRTFGRQFDFSLDFWWLYLIYLGAVRPAVGLGLGLATLAAATLTGVRAASLARRLGSSP